MMLFKISIITFIVAVGTLGLTIAYMLDHYLF